MSAVAIPTLDQFFHRAGIAAFGRDAAPFVWLAMAYVALVTVIVSFAVVCISYSDNDLYVVALPPSIGHEEHLPLPPPSPRRLRTSPDPCWRKRYAADGSNSNLLHR